MARGLHVQTDEFMRAASICSMYVHTIAYHLCPHCTGTARAIASGNYLRSGQVLTVYLGFLVDVITHRLQSCIVIRQHGTERREGRK